MVTSSREFSDALKRLNANRRTAFVKGVRKAVAFVKLESQKKVPVDEGNLKASAYANVEHDKDKVSSEIGYTAKYASFVHEAPMKLKGQPRKTKLKSGRAKGKYWDPQATTTNKFLEKAINENLQRLLEIIKKVVSNAK